MADPIAGFYDALAGQYHLMFENWRASTARQAAALQRVIESRCGPAPSVRVLDCACGIGTQALGLAKLGFQVVGSDISAAAIRRAGEEAVAAGLEVPLYVADMRRLEAVPQGEFDAVICMDNTLPHLMSDEDVRQATTQIRSKLRPRGTLFASIRNYDRLVAERPVIQGPAFYSDAGKRRIVFQLWDWLDERRYMFHLYITRETEDGWQVHHGVSIYRAILLQELTGILKTSGFSDVLWLMPDQSGFYQPVVAATAV
jgi:SAM-dependent methyltransferase